MGMVRLVPAEGWPLAWAGYRHRLRMYVGNKVPVLLRGGEDGFHICLYVRVCILVDGEACACMLDEQMQDSGRRKRWKVAYNLLCHQVKATPARG